MKNLYLLDRALAVPDEDSFFSRMDNLNYVKNEDDGSCEFWCHQNVWSSPIGFGGLSLYDIFSIQRQEAVSVLTFIEQLNKEERPITTQSELDERFADHWNGFMGLNFADDENEEIAENKRVHNHTSYRHFLRDGYKFGKVRDLDGLRRNLQCLYPNFDFEPQALEDVWEIKHSWSANTYLRLHDLLDDIPENTFQGGLGDTEHLINLNLCSKRLNRRDRISYQPYGQGRFRVFRCLGHYEF